MCGSVGDVGPRAAAGVLLDGLLRIDYRGCDSAGLALFEARRGLLACHVARRRGCAIDQPRTLAESVTVE